MKRLLPFFFLATLNLRGQEIIPLPARIVPASGHFHFSGATQVILSENATLPAWIHSALTQKQEVLSEKGESNTLEMSISGEGNPEGYSLRIEPRRITLIGHAAPGLFYGVHSLLQMLQLGELAGGAIAIPCQFIADQPRFGYRGVMLDAGRYFHPVATVKELLDFMALYKFNTFHWHLTEDQGWRVEIEKYPRLMAKSAWRDETLVGHLNQKPKAYDGVRHGGYYTKADIREVVAYAADRHIQVIPEIEMPGHATAAIAAYPEFGCTGKELAVPRDWGVKYDVYCPSEATFAFLQDVLSEIIPLFPSPYIHIGGDECPKKQWKESELAQSVIRREGLKNEDELQSYFIRRMEAFLKTKGKKLIGWDEILEGGLAPEATVMSWRGMKGGIEAAEQGHDVIMSPTNYCYLDYYHTDAPGEPLAIGGLLPVEKVYAFEPIPGELPLAAHKHILGGQGNIWTEYIATLPKLRYMAYTRLMALSEVLWTPAERKAFLPFALRLHRHIGYWESKGMTLANHLFDIRTKTAIQPQGLAVTLQPLLSWGEIRYSLDGSSPSQSSPVYTQPLTLSTPTQLLAQTFLQGQAKGRPISLDFQPHAGLSAKVIAATAPSPTYQGGGERGLLNGVAGRSDRYLDGEWQGFTPGENFSVKLQWDKKVAVGRVRFQAFRDPASWIYPPSEAEVWLSRDGKTYEKAGAITLTTGDDTGAVLAEIPVRRRTNYLELRIPSPGLIPGTLPGAGNQAWLFLDEIRILP